MTPQATVPLRCLLAFAAKWAQLMALRQSEGAVVAALQQVELIRCNLDCKVVKALVKAQRE